MFKFEVAKSPRQIYGAFDRLLGRERAQAFWQQFRDTYIARDDIRFIKSVGFNTVRIPLHYRLFMDADGEIAGDGWVAARPRAGLGARGGPATPSSTCMPRPAARPASTTTTGRAIR